MLGNSLSKFEVWEMFVDETPQLEHSEGFVEVRDLRWKRRDHKGERERSEGFNRVKRHHVKGRG